MTSHESQGPERRRSKRYDYPGKVTILCADTGATQSGVLINLSMGGCLLKLKSSEEQMALPPLETAASSTGQACRAIGGFEENAIINALFQVSYVPFLATGTVRRCDEDGSLIGLAFQDLSKRGRADLQKLFSTLESLAKLSAIHGASFRKIPGKSAYDDRF
jgi:c-di-GMP-binding flagellar brake protein YcgR